MEIYTEKQIYRFTKMSELADDIYHVKKVYLDLRYWISMRDAINNNDQDSEYYRIYRKLKKLVDDKKAVCPISSCIFYEIIKQSGSDKYLKTIEIVDELSRDIIITTEKDIVYQEFLKIFGNYLNVYAKYSNLHWSKVFEVLDTDLFLDKGYLDTNPVNELFKSHFDSNWNKTLTELVQRSHFGLDRIDPIVFDFNLLNQNNKSHENEIRSYEKLLQNERKGVLDVYKIIAWRAYTSVITANNISMSEQSKLDNFYKFMSSCVQDNSRFIGAIEIPARIHSLIRYEKRDYKESNDIYDYHHSIAALPFFDYFFTDEKMAKVLTHKLVKLDSIFQCVISYNKTNSLYELEKIA